jgi:hypothetical protein
MRASEPYSLRRERRLRGWRAVLYWLCRARFTVLLPP